MLYMLHFIIRLLVFNSLMSELSEAVRSANDHQKAADYLTLELESENFIPLHNKEIMDDNSTKELGEIYNEISKKISSMLDDEEGSGLETDKPITLTTITSLTQATSPTLATPVTSPTVPTIATLPTLPTPDTSPTVPTIATSPTLPTPDTTPTVPTIATSPTLPTPGTSPTVPTIATSPTLPTPVTSTDPILATSTQISISGSECGSNRCEKKYNERCERRDGVHVCGCLRGFARRPNSLDRKCYAVEVMTVEMKFTKMEFKPEYEDIYSLEYNELIQNVINTTVSGIDGSILNDSFAVVTIKAVRRGSVIVDMELNFIHKPNINLDLPLYVTDLKTNVETILHILSTTTAGVEFNLTGKLENCQDFRLNYCHEDATCLYTNKIQCKCKEGFQDMSEDADKPGETCLDPCTPDYCFNGGRCKYSSESNYCLCSKWFVGDRCQLDMRVVLSVIMAVVFIIIISCFLCMYMYCKVKKKNIEQLFERGNDSNPEDGYLSDDHTYNPPNDYGFTEEDEHRWLDIAEALSPDCLSVHPSTNHILGAASLPNIDSISSLSSQSMASRLHLRNKDQLFSREFPRSCTFLPSDTNFINPPAALRKSLVQTHYSDSYSGDSFF